MHIPTARLDRYDLRHTTHDLRKIERRGTKAQIYTELSL